MLQIGSCRSKLCISCGSLWYHQLYFCPAMGTIRAMRKGLPQSMCTNGSYKGEKQGDLHFQLYRGGTWHFWCSLTRSLSGCCPPWPIPGHLHFKQWLWTDGWIERECKWKLLMSKSNIKSSWGVLTLQIDWEKFVVFRRRLTSGGIGYFSFWLIHRWSMLGYFIVRTWHAYTPPYTHMNFNL